MEKSYRNTTQEIINARKQKKSSGKVYLNFLVIVCGLPQEPSH